MSFFPSNKLNRTFIIAEIGVNHNGSLATAIKLVKIAKKIGADAIKLQSFKTDKLTLKTTKLTNYQKKNLKKKLSHYEMLKQLELSEKNQKKIINLCRRIKIEFISTPFDIDSALFLHKQIIKYFKTSSPDLSDIFLHKFLSKLNKKIIISTGMSNEKEIKKCLNNYKNKKNIALLHCVSNYPSSYNAMNINCLETLKKYSKIYGLSDHTLDFLASITAVAKGAKIIEKHFTLDKKMEGPDHKFSLNPKEMKEFIFQIRNVEKILGKNKKFCQPEERPIKKITVKSLVSLKDIPKGKKLIKDDFILLRAGYGISGFDLDRVINKVSKTEIKKGKVLNFKHIK